MKSNVDENKMKNVKSKLFMYVQQIKWLPFENVEALERRVKTLHNLDKYAMIVHDKDDAEPHVHVVMSFKKRVLLRTVAKHLNDDLNHIEVGTKKGISLEMSKQNNFLYLIHGTKNSLSKHQYSADDVKANFHYKQYIEVVKKKYQGKLTYKEIVSMYSQGKLSSIQTRRMVKEYFPTKITSLNNTMKGLDEVSQEMEQAKWLENTDKDSKKVFWFYGAGGVGKSAAAKHIMEAKYNDYFDSGASRDIFQDYAGQHGIILDDLRPSNIDYSDLLKMLDPFNIEVAGSSRYHNKKLLADIYIITSPFSPYDFYSALKEKGKISELDGYDQLQRRIDKVLEFNTDIKLKEITEKSGKVEQHDVETTSNPIFEKKGQKRIPKEDMDELYGVVDKLLSIQE